MPTDKKFTGQRVDNTGLYYYGARYYDPKIGRFISPDPIVQSPANPQTLNRYSYVLNNPLKYIDPSGLIVEFENEEYLMSLPDEVWSMIGVGSWLYEMVEDWVEDRLEWEELREEEPEYTQHMIDSDITFSIIDIDLTQKMITYNVNMRGEVKFDEPVQLCLVRKGDPGYDMLMNALGSAGGASLYPGAIFIRTDIKRTTESFTWLVAHESFHRWEQSKGGSINRYFWYFGYLIETSAGTPHDYWPSEIRANDYADFFYGGRYSRTHFKHMNIW